MTVKHNALRAFHAVATQGSFSRAGHVLHVSQPTLSGQVSELEQRFGVQLLKRHSRGTDLTELGRALFQHTTSLFETYAQIDNLLVSAYGLVTGELKVGADAPYHVLPLLAGFARRYPGVTLSLAFGNSQNVLTGLRRGEYDIAVLPNITPGDRLVAVPLASDHLVILAPLAHPFGARRSVGLREIVGQALVLREKGSTTRAIFEKAVSDSGLVLENVMEIGSREGIREAVAAGLGIGVVPWSERGNDNRLHYISVRDADLKNTEYVCCQRARRARAPIQAFIDLVPPLGVT